MINLSNFRAPVPRFVSFRFGKAHRLTLTLLGLLLASSQVAFAAPACQDVFAGDPVSIVEGENKALQRFLGLHRMIGRDNALANEQVHTDFINEAYLGAARKAVQTERQIVARFADGKHHPRTFFDLKSTNDFVGGSPHVRNYKRLGGEVMQKSDFKALNAALGDSGAWLVFRAYSWSHLGYRRMAGPHMSIIIGNRAYEIGRHLITEDGVARLTTRGPAGPVAFDLDEFLLKTSLESAELNAQPGMFFAERIAGVGAEELKALAAYYEREAELFRDGMKPFKYVMDPGKDPTGRNCVTYLTEPILDAALTGGYDLRAGFGLRRYDSSPTALMLEAAGWGIPKMVQPFLFVEGDAWRANLDAQLAESAAGEFVTDPALSATWYDDPRNHSQLNGFFFRGMRFRR